jgi:hypothetical protein
MLNSGGYKNMFVAGAFDFRLEINDCGNKLVMCRSLTTKDFHHVVAYSYVCMGDGKLRMI